MVRRRKYKNGTREEKIGKNKKPDTDFIKVEILKILFRSQLI